MKFNLPEKCGEMYIYFDENRKPLYGFKVIGYEEKCIAEFVKMTDELPEFIVLPVLNKDAYVPAAKRQELNFEDLGISQSQEDYLKGNLKICSSCFKGLKQTKIVLPFNTSVMIDWGSFDDKAKIEFIVPKNVGLKQIYRTFDTMFDYEHENWTLLCDKRIKGDIGNYGDNMSIGDYTDDCNHFNKYKISEDYFVDTKTQEIVERTHTNEK